jgi:hypothetical protein
MLITLVIAVIFVINIVFGYWRANTRKFSLQWIGAIHLPVPMAIGLRLWLLGWNWLLVPVFVLDFAAGQYAGGRIRSLISKRTEPTSWLFGDVARLALEPSRDDSEDPGS